MTYLRKKPVDPILPERARVMRHDSAPAEAKLWAFLRNRQLGNFKFRRQHSQSPYITDFFCVDANLVIELDGDSHRDSEAYDALRTVFLELNGYRVIRFFNDDVRWHLDAVLETILAECERLGASRPHPNPLPEGAGTRLAEGTNP